MVLISFDYEKDVLAKAQLLKMFTSAYFFSPVLP